jgi:hypothetical protein
MAKKHNPNQGDLFNDWLIIDEAIETVQAQDKSTVSSDSLQPKEQDTLTIAFDKSRHSLAQRWAEKLDNDGEMTSRFLTDAANQAIGGEIATAKVNYEDRIELKGRGNLTDAEKRVLKEQGAFLSASVGPIEFLFPQARVA